MIPSYGHLDSRSRQEGIRSDPYHPPAATVGEDEHSVGLHEILDVKHGGIEKDRVQEAHMRHLAELARHCGLDAGFGRGTTGRDVASFLVRALRQRR